MGKIDVNKMKKRNALFQTSFELFLEKGFARTTISDIVKRAGLAKGTFYLYFKDKYDLRDRLVIHKTGQLFAEAHAQLLRQDMLSFRESTLFFVDYFVRVLTADPRLLRFISKNLSWGIFMTAVHKNIPEESRDFYEYYLEMMRNENIACSHPELMLFTIIELVGSACHSCILYQEPVSMTDYLPYLKKSVLQIMDGFIGSDTPPTP